MPPISSPSNDVLVAFRLVNSLLCFFDVDILANHLLDLIKVLFVTELGEGVAPFDIE